jgi:hypothetical protein
MNKITFNTQFIKLSVVLLLFVVTSNTWAQINDGGSPVKSFTISEINKSRIPVIQVPAIDLEKVQAEDEIADAEGMKAPRFGVLVPMQIGFSDGVWNELPNGDRIWRLQIKADKAKAVNLYYDDFFMPKGATMHVYSPDKGQVLGGFASHNNSEHNMFVTSLIYGDELVVEYFEPFMVRNQGRISVSDVNHAYRMIDNPYDYELRDFGNSDAACQVNVNCSPEGDGKEGPRDASARILGRVGNSGFWCSGTVMNNVRQDCTPFFLTALHCANDGTGSITSQTDFNQWVFYFNYQASGCTNPGSGASLDDETVTGANIRAHSGDATISTGSDLLLVEFQNAIPQSYNVYYAGWDRGTASTTGGYGIHHPAGDIKKISTFTQTTGTYGWNQAGVTHHTLRWVATANGSGLTEGGSSGSALFNNAGQVIGNLSGGSTLCSDFDNPARQDVYGKMSYHWESNTTSASVSTLKAWLDPDNTNATTLDGVYYPCSIPTEFNDAGITAFLNPVDNTLFCADPFTPEVTIKNYGLNTLSSATINYQIDSGTIYTFNWIGLLSSNASTNVTLPAISAPGTTAFVLQAYTTMPNGQVDPDNTNDGVSITTQKEETIALPYTTDFEDGIPLDILIVDANDDGYAWEINNSVSGFGTGSGSMYVDNFNNATSGTLDWAVFPSFDFSSAQGAFIDFDVAYARYSANNSDTLYLVASSDCGETFDIVYTEGGTDLATAPDVTPLFVPTAAQWVTKNVDLSAYDGLSSVIIALVNECGYGQPIYVDNININATTLSIEEQVLDELVVYPNPASDVLNIKASVQLERVEIYSILGEKILVTEETSQIDVKRLSSGVYLLKIYSENGKSIRRIIIE